MVDKETILQVLCGLMKHPQYFSEKDKYNLTVDDFSSLFDKYIFSAIYNLYQGGAEHISVVDIDNYFNAHETAKKVFERENGIEYLQDALDLTDLDNFPFYYRRLKKFNAIKDLQKMGFDTSKIYCEDLTNPKAKEINDKFEELETPEIFDLVRRKLMSIESNYGSQGASDTQEATFQISELLESLKNRPEVGAPLPGHIFNTICRGSRRGKFYIRTASSGAGKALPNSTLIPTPLGYRRVDEIQVGDWLFDAFGNPTQVLGVYPQGKKEVNYVKFKDGRIAHCCEEHLWSYCTAGQKSNSKKNRQFMTNTLAEIKQKSLQGNDGGYKILVPMAYAVNYPEKKYSIDPYVFGLALGDGSFREQSTNHAFNDYPELINVKSEDKFIPQDYLMGSISQRLNLLNGLLDSDGSIDEKKGNIKFFTISERLKDNVIELCQSLGLKATISIDNHKETHIGYVINITGRPEDKAKLFRLPRKKELLQKWLNNNNRKENNEFNPIIEIGDCGYKEEMTCFYVDNDEHLFLTENYIVTHNTRNAVGDMCYLSYPVRFNPNNWKWEWNGSMEKSLFIATEQEIDEIQTMILSYLTGFDEEKFLYWNFSDNEKVVIEQCKKVMKIYEDNVRIVTLSNPNIEQIKAVIRKNWILYDIKNVFYDYIFSSPSLLNEFRDLRIREDVALGMLSTALKDMAVEMNLFIESSTQTNAKANDENGDKNETVVRGSRAIIDKCDIACVISRLSEEDQARLESVIESMEIKPTHVCDVYKVRRGKYSNVKVWSNIDLGTCRKTDLFITTSDYKIVENFVPVEFNFKFSNDEMKNMTDFIDKLNKNELDLTDDPFVEKTEIIEIEDIKVEKGAFDGLL